MKSTQTDSARVIPYFLEEYLKKNHFSSQDTVPLGELADSFTWEWSSNTNDPPVKLTARQFAKVILSSSRFNLWQNDSDDVRQWKVSLDGAYGGCGLEGHTCVLYSCHVVKYVRDYGMENEWIPMSRLVDVVKQRVGEKFCTYYRNMSLEELVHVSGCFVSSPSAAGASDTTVQLIAKLRQNAPPVQDTPREQPVQAPNYPAHASNTNWSVENRPGDLHKRPGQVTRGWQMESQTKDTFAENRPRDPRERPPDPRERPPDPRERLPDPRERPPDPRERPPDPRERPPDPRGPPRSDTKMDHLYRARFFLAFAYQLSGCVRSRVEWDIDIDRMRAEAESMGIFEQTGDPRDENKLDKILDSAQTMRQKFFEGIDRLAKDHGNAVHNFFKEWKEGKFKTSMSAMPPLPVSEEFDHMNFFREVTSLLHYMKNQSKDPASTWPPREELESGSWAESWSVFVKYFEISWWYDKYRKKFREDPLSRPTPGPGLNHSRKEQNQSRSEYTEHRHPQESRRLASSPTPSPRIEHAPPPVPQSWKESQPETKTTIIRPRAKFGGALPPSATRVSGNPGRDDKNRSDARLSALPDEPLAPAAIQSSHSKKRMNKGHHERHISSVAARSQQGQGSTNDPQGLIHGDSSPERLPSQAKASENDARKSNPGSLLPGIAVEFSDSDDEPLASISKRRQSSGKPEASVNHAKKRKRPREDNTEVEPDSDQSQSEEEIRGKNRKKRKNVFVESESESDDTSPAKKHAKKNDTGPSTKNEELKEEIVVEMPFRNTESRAIRCGSPVSDNEYDPDEPFGITSEEQSDNLLFMKRIASVVYEYGGAPDFISLLGERAIVEWKQRVGDASSVKLRNSSFVTSLRKRIAKKLSRRSQKNMSFKMKEALVLLAKDFLFGGEGIDAPFQRSKHLRRGAIEQMEALDNHERKNLKG